MGVHDGHRHLVADDLECGRATFLHRRRASRRDSRREFLTRRVKLVALHQPRKLGEGEQRQRADHHDDDEQFGKCVTAALATHWTPGLSWWWRRQGAWLG